MNRSTDAKVVALNSLIAAWLLAATLLPISYSEASAASSTENARLEALNDVVKHCLQTGQYKAGLAPAIQAVEIAEQLGGQNDPAVATALVGLGRMFGGSGNHSEEAIAALNRALQIDASVGSNTQAIARDLLHLARQLQESRRFDAAAKTYARLIALDQRLYGPDHQNVARDLDGLARLLRDFGDGDSAESLQRRSVSILDHLYRDNPGLWSGPLAVALNNLADGLSEDQRFEESEELFRRALALNEQYLGSDDPEVALSLNNLAEVLRKRRRYTDAEPLFVRAIKMDQERFGPSHPKVATLLNNFAKLLRDTNRRSEAETMFRKALALDEAAFGPVHPTIARDLKNLAHLMLLSQRGEEGVLLMRRVVDILKRQQIDSGAPVFEMGQALGFLGELVVAAGDPHAGEDLFRQGLALDEENYGKSSGAVEKDLRRYADFLQRSHRAAEAEMFLRRASEIRGELSRKRQVSEQQTQCLLSGCDGSL